MQERLYGVFSDCEAQQSPRSQGGEGPIWSSSQKTSLRDLALLRPSLCAVGHYTASLGLSLVLRYAGMVALVLPGSQGSYVCKDALP